MSGDFFRVFGGGIRLHSEAGAERCPPQLRGRTVRLQAVGGEVFVLPAEAACVSNRLRAAAASMGLEHPFPIAFRKKTVAKLVEFFKYHQDKPVCEVVRPVSDGLVDAGVSRWDAQWVNCGMDMFFDLMLAGSMLAVPSLLYLTSAQMAVIAKGKSPDKLRRDFGMTNDLPASEEARLLDHYFAEMEHNHGAATSELGLWGAVIMVHGLTNAAARNGVQVACKTEAPAEASPLDRKSWRLQAWRVVVLQDWSALRDAPIECKNDRELVFACIKLSAGAALPYASAALRGDRELVFEAVRLRGDVLRYADDALRTDRGFVLEAVLANGDALVGASEGLRGDRSLVLEAARHGQGSALQGASEALRREVDFVLECVALDPESLRHAAPELLESRAFALAAASRRGISLRHMLPRFQADREVVAAAVANDPQAALYMHTARRRELGICVDWERRVQAGIAEDVCATEVSIPSGHRRVALTRAAQQEDWVPSTKLHKAVYFSALSTPMGNMGQANYTAANIYMEKLPAYQRPEIDGVSILWGAVGHIGMRWKAFASADALNATPEALMSVVDASRILRVTCCLMNPPEICGAGFFDAVARQVMLSEGESGRRGGWLPTRDAGPAEAGWLPRPRWRPPLGAVQREDWGGAAVPRGTARDSGWSGKQKRGRQGGGVHGRDLDEELSSAAGVSSPSDCESSAGRPEQPLRGWPELHADPSKSGGSSGDRLPEGGAAEEKTRSPLEVQAPLVGEPPALLDEEDGGPQASREGPPPPPASCGAQEEMVEDLPPMPPDPHLTEGARVELCHLQSKNGLQGTLLKQTVEGKWKVRLDGGLGVALLKAVYLRPIAAGGEGGPTVATGHSAPPSSPSLAAVSVNPVRAHSPPRW